MAREGVNQADLVLLSAAGSKFKLIATPICDDKGAIWWTLDVILGGSDRRPIVKTVRVKREEGKRKVWRQLSALYCFVREAAPDVSQITLEMHEKREGKL